MRYPVCPIFCEYRRSEWTKKGPERLAPAHLSLRSQEERREAGLEEERRSSNPAKLVDQL
jgi:hypothetical protein